MSERHYLLAIDDGVHILGRVDGDVERWLELLERINRTEVFEDYRIAAVNVRRLLVEYPQSVLNCTSNEKWRHDRGLFRLAEAIPLPADVERCFGHVRANWRLSDFHEQVGTWERALDALAPDPVIPPIPVPAIGTPVATCWGCGTKYLKDCVSEVHGICPMCHLTAEESPFDCGVLNIVSEELWMAAYRRMCEKLNPYVPECENCGTRWINEDFVSVRSRVCAMCDMSLQPLFFNQINRAAVERILTRPQRVALGFAW